MKVTVLLIIALPVIRAQDFDYEKPENLEKCTGNVEILDRRCCKLPPFYSQTISRTCGALLSISSMSHDNQTVYLRRNIGNRCDYWKCVLQKYNLMVDSKALSIDKLFEHFDRWCQLNPLFEEVMEKAKHNCRNHYRNNDAQINACDYFELQSCMRHYINLDCPDLVDSDECREQKAFYDECRNHFL